MKAGMARRGVLAVIVAFAAMAAPAQATIRQGAASDPAGDSTGGAGSDITAVAGKTDDAGMAAVAITTSSAAWSGVWMVGVAGTRSGDACGAPLVVFVADPTTRQVFFGREDEDTTEGQMNVDGSTVTLFASDPSLAVPLDCALAYTLPAGTSDPNTAFDTTLAAPAVLDAEAPPAATATPTPAPPAPTPTPAPAAATPAPAPTTATKAPVAVPKAAKLTVSLDGAPSTIKRNKAMTLKLKIANDGSKKSGSVSVSFAKARGLSGVSKAKKLSAFKAGQKRTLKLKVKLTKSARVSTTLKVTVRSGKLKTSSSLLLKIGKAKKVVAGAPGAPPTPEAEKSPIVGTYWWRNVNHVDYAWDNRALYFVDGGAVYSGFPAGGLPETCATPPAKPDEEIDIRDGCLPYTFDEATGTVTIGDKTGTFKDGKLTIDGNSYFPLIPAAPGTRFTINDHEHKGFSGMCGFITGCTITEKYLSLLPDGQFVLSRSTTASVGDPGFGPYTVAGSYPADQHGSYEVQAGGKIQLSYADGTVQVQTFAIDTKDGAPDPMGEGVFIGEDNFYPDPSP